MQFSNFTRSEEGNIIRFYTPNPLKGVTNIKYYSDNASGSFQKKEFRWSFDSNYWASWETLNQGNLSGINIGSNAYLFLEIRYTSAGGTVTSFNLNYDGAAQTEYTGQSGPPDSEYVAPDQTVRDSYTPGSTPGSPGVIDADYLCGKDCQYYLWRPNHKGQQPISSITDLQKTLNAITSSIQGFVSSGENIGNGIGVFYDRDGENLVFKSIDASGTGITISEQDGTIYLEVDASITYNDASVNELYILYNSLETDIQDLSIYIDSKFVQIDNHLTQIDSSIDDLYQRIADISIGGDSSIYGLQNIGGGPGEIFKEIDLGIAKLRTIEGAGQIDVSTVGDMIIISLDASITSDSSIRGAENIGGGAGEVFSSIDPSGNLELRTIDGSGATTVLTAGDKIIISTEIVPDSSVLDIINIPTGSGEGLVLADIDSSGTARLRNITGTGAISVSTAGDNVVLYIDPSGITVDPCTWTDTDAISADVGGLEGGDFVTPGSNAIEILEDILYEYFPPAGYVQIDPSPGPTSPNGYYEKFVAAPFAQGATYTYRYNNADFSKIRIDDVSMFRNGTFFNNDSWGGTTDTGIRTISDGSPPINSGLGAADQDLIISLEIGNTVDGIAMTTYDVSTAALWTNPYFYGVVQDSVNYTNVTNSDILGLNKLIVPEQTNQISYDVSANYTKLKFVYAYPASYTDIVSIFDVKNDFNVTSSFDSSIINVKMSGPLGPGPFVPYKVYIKSHWISFTPDVSIFKLIFNI